MKTKVKFLIEKDSENDVWAFFPEEIAHDYFLTCYAHIGQHSACHPDYAKECKEANYDQYSDLKKELESIGYKLEILNTDFKRQDAINKGKVWTVYYDYNKEDYLFEGLKTQCLDFIKNHNLKSLYKKGEVRLAKVIYEPSLVS